MVKLRFRKNIFEYHGIRPYSKYFRAAFVYRLVFSSWCVDPGSGGGEALCLNSAVRGHYIYKDILSSVQGEELHCKHEISTERTLHNLYAVSVIRDGASIVGHRPF